MRLFASPEMFERCQNLHILTLQLVIAGGDATHSLIEDVKMCKQIYKARKASREKIRFLDFTEQHIYDINDKFIQLSSSVKPDFETLYRFMRAGRITRATNHMSKMSDELESLRQDLTTAYANMNQIKEAIAKW